MAHLDVTDWNDLQATNATNEKRKSQLGIVDAVKDSTPATSEYISPSSVAALREASSLRNVQIPVLKDQTVSVVTTPGFNFIPSNLPESDQYSFTAVDVFSGFRHYPAQYANNVIDAEWAKQEVMGNVAYEMGKTVEGILATTLSNRKSQLLGFTEQVSAASGDYAFDSGTDTLKIKKAAQEETMFFSLEKLMEANELGGDYRIVTNRAGLARQKAETLKYGANNEQNKQALGFFGADRMYESGNISTSAKFDGYLLRDGAIGIIENHPHDFRAGTNFAGKNWSITDMELPWARMRANVYTNNEATEATALVSAGTDSNLIMTHFSEMAIWLRFYIVYRYNSSLSTRPNDIVKIQGLTS